jgi:hypothetical protein
MKQLTILFLAGAILASCNNKNSSKLPTDLVNISATADGETATDNKNKPVITFEKNKHDFGTLVEGEVVEYNFKFTNTGDADLLIVKAAASCGCTVPDYPRELIKPGGTGSLKVKFDSGGKSGTFSNTEPRETELISTGDIKTK